MSPSIHSESHHRARYNVSTLPMGYPENLWHGIILDDLPRAAFQMRAIFLQQDYTPKYTET